MKKIWNILLLSAFVGGLVSCSDCESDKLKECQEKLASCEETNSSAEGEDANESLVVKDSASVVADLVSINGDGFLLGPVGNLSDGDSAGYNICLKYAGKKSGVVASLIYTDGTNVVNKGSLVLDSKLGVEIYLSGTNPDVNFSIVGSKFKHDVYSLTVGGGNPFKFDGKISEACSAIDPTNEPPAIVGVNDARTASYQSANGIIGNLSGGNRIRIHADKLPGGGYDVVFSSDSLKVNHNANYKFSSLGVPKWGCDFNVVH